MAETRVACPVCKCLTLPARGGYDICEVCFWEDDGTDDPDATGGPNGAVSLAAARANYRAFGACDAAARAKVRPPRADELPRTC
jgi:hypothetical protein